jgi:hypothetical protein
MPSKTLTVLPDLFLVAVSVLALYYLLSCLRKLNGTDESSIAYRAQVEQRIKNSSFTQSVKDYKKALLLGICGCIFLLSVLTIRLIIVLK